MPLPINIVPLIPRLIWNQHDFIVSVTNYTGGATQTIRPTGTVIVDSTLGPTVYCKPVILTNYHFGDNKANEALYIIEKR